LLFHELDKMAKCGAVLALFVLFPLARAQERPSHAERDNKAVYVGLIEDDRHQLANLGPRDFGLVKNRTITPAFVKDASGWKPVKQLNQRVTWTVAFDGKKLGVVVSEPVSGSDTSEKAPGPSDTHSILTPTDKIPEVGKPNGKFNGNFETAVRRPLVVVSEPNFTDPDGWRREGVPDQVAGPVRSSFRGVFQHVRQCDPSGEPLETDWYLSDSEIVVSKAYVSNKGSFIVETQLKHNHCVFNLDGSRLQSLEGDQWFYVAPDRQVTHLGDDWQLVDAGDYDSDRKSEVIFYVAEGRQDFVETEGYILFYDDFRRNVRFTWSDR